MANDDPKINKSAWTKEEDKMLLSLAKKYKGHDWITIAKELGVQFRFIS